MVKTLVFSEQSIGSVNSRDMVPTGELWQIDSSQPGLPYLYSVLVNSHKLVSFNEAINLFLKEGRRYFGMEYALVTRRVSESVYEVQAFSSDEDEDRFYVGQHVSTSEFLCHRATPDSAPVFVANLAESGKVVSPLSYAGLSLRSYLGIGISTLHSSSCVICFFSSSSQKKTALSSSDQSFVTQLAAGVAYLLDQQKSHAQRKNIDSTMFANGSISTLDEYLAQAKLPELYGIPGRVVDVLKKRIGISPLSIGHIAEELNLSKRTLQRRLQQQSVNFAELRDQVRYHYSIDYLVRNQKSIDSISVALDFSDRTSFTNAFKRWTGLSPSTFRKLFRDFV